MMEEIDVVNKEELKRDRVWRKRLYGTGRQKKS